MTLLVDRNDLALELLHARVPPGTARCAGDRLATDPELVTLLAEQELTPSQEDRFTQLLTDAVVTCRTR